MSELRYWHGLDSSTARPNRLRLGEIFWGLVYGLIVLNLIALTVVAIVQQFG